MLSRLSGLAVIVAVVTLAAAGCSGGTGDGGNTGTGYNGAAATNGPGGTAAGGNNNGNGNGNNRGNNGGGPGATGGGVDGDAVVTHAADPQPGGRTVTKAQFGAKWPLKIDSGTLHCTGNSTTGAVTLYADGVTYALNLPAAGDGHAGAGPIWLDDRANVGMKKPMGPLVVEGLKLCR